MIPDMTSASDVHLFSWAGENAIWLLPIIAFISGASAWALKLYLTNREARFATSEALSDCKKENTLEHKSIVKNMSKIGAKQELIEAKQSILEELQINHHKETSVKLNNLHTLLISVIQFRGEGK